MEAIYALGNPTDGEIYYVGRTAAPSMRWAQHYSATENYSDSLRHAMNRRITALGLIPVMVLLEWTENGKQRELYWMQAMRRLGYTLANGGKKGLL